MQIEPSNSEFGTLWATWSSKGLYRLAWSKPSHADLIHLQGSMETEDLTSDRAARSKQLADRVQDYFAGSAVDFAELELDLTGYTQLSKLIYRRCQQIPFGQTWTYKQLASSAGRPTASRAAGSAMARNRFLLIIPCHRVIASDGSLGGYSAADGLVTKRRLLALEKCSSRCMNEVPV